MWIHNLRGKGHAKKVMAITNEMEGQCGCVRCLMLPNEQPNMKPSNS